MKLRYFYYVLFACIVFATLFLIFSGSKNNTPYFESTKVKRGIVSHIVSVTGHVEPVSRINMSFPISGRLTSKLVEEGTNVLRGEVIAELDGEVLRSAVSESKAKAEMQKAVLDDLTSPLRSEELALKETAVKNAKTSLDRSEESARISIAHAFVYADDAIHEEADELFNNSSSNPEMGIVFTYGTTNYFIEADSDTKKLLNTQRVEIDNILERMKKNARDYTTPVDELLSSTEKDLQYIEGFLNNLAEVVNSYVPDNSSEQIVYDSFQTTVASARTSINTASTEVSSAYSAYSTANSAYVLAKHDLDLANAGATDEAIKAQKAALAASVASVEAASSKASDAVLRVPFDGIVSKFNYELGEVVGPYAPVAELISKGTFEVEAYIPEVDIAKVKLGDKAKITFDAFSNADVFDAEVVRIALSETLKEGVPAYKTTLRLTGENNKKLVLRPGMTANIDIKTDEKKNVLYVPTRSVLHKNGNAYIKYFNGKDFLEKKVKTGLRSSEGIVEIVSGLNEGEEVVLYIDNK